MDISIDIFQIHAHAHVHSSLKCLLLVLTRTQPECFRDFLLRTVSIGGSRSDSAEHQALQRLDAHADVPVCIAHDPTLLKVLPFLNDQYLTSNESRLSGARIRPAQGRLRGQSTASGPPKSVKWGRRAPSTRQSFSGSSLPTLEH